MQFTDEKDEKLIYDIRFWLILGSSLYLFLTAIGVIN